MTTLDPDETAFVSAIATLDLDGMADSAVLAHGALVAGTRVRRRRTAVGFSCAAVLAVGLGGSLWGVARDGNADGPATGVATGPSHAGHSQKQLQRPTRERHHPEKQRQHQAPPKHRTLPHVPILSAADLQDAYAVLDDPGWGAPSPQSYVTDEKLYYRSSGEAGAVLNWRVPGSLDKPGDLIGTATIDGDPAKVYLTRSVDIYTVVGPARDGRILTLSGTPAVGLDEIRDLAAHVHRQ